MKKSFEVAVKQQAEVDEAEDQETPPPWFEFSILDQEFVVPKKPSPAQTIIVINGLASGGGEHVRSLFAFLDNVLEGDGGRRLKRMLERDQIPYDLIWGGDENNEEGIVDTILSLASENPTEEPSGSSASSETTGKSSTGRSPGRGSTRSN